MGKKARSIRITVRLHPHEMQALSMLARDEGAKNLSAFVRGLPKNSPKNIEAA